MINNDPEIFDYDIELENILKPKVDFRVSPGFKQRVMEEAKTTPVRHRHRWIPIAAFYSAASLAALVIIALTLFRNPESSAEAPSVAASVEIPVRPSSDTIKRDCSAPLTPTPLITEVPIHIHAKVTPSTGPVKKMSISSGATDEVHPLPVTEGEMPKISREGTLDPDEVRTRLLETRRNAEIAYIEQMRDEIEANQAYIAQLMAEVNVNQ